MSKLNKKMIKQIEDTVNHKKLFLDSANLMFNLLLEIGENDLALGVIRRASVHDNSKFSDIEIEALSQISEKQENKDGFTNPEYKLNNEQLELIKTHWKHNRHHPEHFNSIYDMNTLDILEMICDWHARSKEYGTDLIEFVIKRQANRFNFPSDLFKAILGICIIMVTEDKKKETK